MNEEMGAKVTEKATVPGNRRVKSWRSILLCVGIFILGGLTGSALTAHVIHSMMTKPFRNSDEMAIRMLSGLKRDLGLTEEQADKILPILKSGHNKLNSNFREVFRAMHEGIRAVLTDEQAARWDERTREMDRDMFGSENPETGHNPNSP